MSTKNSVKWFKVIRHIEVNGRIVAIAMEQDAPDVYGNDYEFKTPKPLDPDDHDLDPSVGIVW